MSPLAQRACWALKAFISTGNSEGHSISGKYKKRQPRSCAIGEICILGKRVVLPAAGVLDGHSPPDARSAVEIEETPAAGARAMLDDEMAVQENAFDFRES